MDWLVPLEKSRASLFDMKKLFSTENVIADIVQKMLIFI